MARKVTIKCKTCGNTLGTFKFKSELTFDFKCKKCKSRNIGILKEIHGKKSTK